MHKEQWRRWREGRPTWRGGEDDAKSDGELHIQINNLILYDDDGGDASVGVAMRSSSQGDYDDMDWWMFDLLW